MTGYRRDILEPCVHRESGMTTAILYCGVLAIGFVAALYIFVPRSVRRLPRDHPTQIQFRSLACLIVCIGGMLAYPHLFCDSISGDNNQQHKGTLFSIGKIILLPSLENGLFYGLFGVLLHTCILYTGSSIGYLLIIHEIRKRSVRQGSNQTVTEFIRWYIRNRMLPNSERDFWITIRNCCIAPMTEEIVFRGSMVPALLATGMSTGKVSLAAPLFFGFAHLHHAATRISNGDPLRLVVLITIFQFLYTTLFGCYASYAFIRAGSVLPVIFSHSYCNWMGLPDFGFVSSNYHPLRHYRAYLLLAYAIGICAFWYVFRVDLLLPWPPQLPPLVNSGS